MPHVPCPALEAFLSTWPGDPSGLDTARRRAIAIALIADANVVGVGRSLLEFDPALHLDADQLRTLRDAIADPATPLSPATRDRAQRRLDSVVEALVQRRLVDAHRVALSDALTGVGNRASAMRELRTTLAATVRQARVMTVAIVDLDGLKEINDTDGHAAGDAALRAVANALRDATRAEDSVHRVGGDEFLVIAPAADAQTMKRIVERARRRAPRFSAGAAVAPMDGTTSDELLAVADARMYFDKGSVARH